MHETIKLFPSVFYIFKGFGYKEKGFFIDQKIRKVEVNGTLGYKEI